MARAIHVGTWQIQTNAGDANQADDVTGIYPFRQKLDVMKQVITQFYSGIGIGGTGAATATPPLSVFVAPEYYFKKALGERALSEAERDLFVQEMSTLAQSKANLLILPGTIVWKKDVSSDGKARKKAQLRLITRQFTVGITGDIENANMTQKRLQLGVRGPGSVGFVAYNTAYLFYGNERFKYHKMNDATELAAGDLDTLFIPGSSSGVYKIANLDVGVEICADHSAGMLKQEVDLHLISSALVSRDARRVQARDGGWFVNCTNAFVDVAVVDRSGPAPTFTKPTQVGQVRPNLPNIPTLQSEVERRLKAVRDTGVAPESAEKKRSGITSQVQVILGGKLTTWSGVLNA